MRQSNSVASTSFLSESEPHIAYRRRSWQLLCDITFEDCWDKSECHNHINWFELKACWPGLRNYVRDCHSRHMIVRLDDSCAISYINNQDGNIKNLDELTIAF